MSYKNTISVEVKCAGCDETILDETVINPDRMDWLSYNGPRVEVNTEERHCCNGCFDKFRVAITSALGIIGGEPDRKNTQIAFYKDGKSNY